MKNLAYACLLFCASVASTVHAQPIQNRAVVQSEVTSTTDGNFAVFSGTHGKRIKDGGSISSVGGVPSTRTIATTSPIGGGGDLSADRTLTCTTCATGPGSSTAKGLSSFSGAGGLALAASATTLADDDYSLTMLSTATGFGHYNTASKTVSTEIGTLGWLSNVWTLKTTGSGTIRNLALAVGSSSTYTQSNTFALAGSATTGSGALLALSNAGSVSSTSLVQLGVSLTTTVNQSSGTGGYDAFKANLTLTAVGSSGANLFRGQVASSDRWKVDSNGKMGLQGTVTANGTTGAQTINKPLGTVNFGIGATTLVVTDSLITTTTPVSCTVQTNDTTAKSCGAVPASGSVTLFLNAAATAETKALFIVWDAI